MISIMTVVKITRSSGTASAAAGIAAEQLKIRVSGIVHHVQNHLAGSISPQLAKRASLLGQWSSLSLGVSIMCEKGGALYSLFLSLYFIYCSITIEKTIQREAYRPAMLACVAWGRGGKQGHLGQRGTNSLVPNIPGQVKQDNILLYWTVKAREERISL